MDESKLDGNQLDASHPWQESILTNSFDDQIKLVERSVARSKNDSAKEKKKNKTTNKKANNNNNAMQETENSHKQHVEHVFTNRSRIYRFDSKEEGVFPQVNIPAQDSIKPPTNPEIIMKQPENESDARASMLMSWYMAGYQTGYYDAMRRKSQ
jgi:hypothetical protein